MGGVLVISHGITRLLIISSHSSLCDVLDPRSHVTKDCNQRCLFIGGQFKSHYQISSAFAICGSASCPLLVCDGGNGFRCHPLTNLRASCSLVKGITYLRGTNLCFKSFSFSLTFLSSSASDLNSSTWRTFVVPPAILQCRFRHLPSLCSKPTTSYLLSSPTSAVNRTKCSDLAF